MISIAAWNIRGMNRPLKQMEVRQVICNNQIKVRGVLESHVDTSRLFGVCKNVFKSWDWCSNGTLCPKGTSIILGWDTSLVDVLLIDQTDQVMHIKIFFKLSNKTVFCSFIYAHNYYVNRRRLWFSLEKHKVFVKDCPWVIMGGFNSTLNNEDSLMGSSTVTTGMRDFQECVQRL